MVEIQGSGGSSLNCLLSRRKQKLTATISQVVQKTSKQLETVFHRQQILQQNTRLQSEACTSGSRGVVAGDERHPDCTAGTHSQQHKHNRRPRNSSSGWSPILKSTRQFARQGSTAALGLWSSARNQLNAGTVLGQKWSSPTPRPTAAQKQEDPLSMRDFSEAHSLSRELCRYGAGGLATE